MHLKLLILALNYTKIIYLRHKAMHRARAKYNFIFFSVYDISVTTIFIDLKMFQSKLVSVSISSYSTSTGIMCFLFLSTFIISYAKLKPILLKLVLFEVIKIISIEKMSASRCDSMM